MKPIYREVLMAAVLGMFVPALILEVAVRMDRVKAPVATVAPEPGATDAADTGITEQPPQRILLRREDGTLEEMSLESYLVGVLLAELPSSFQQEAKKAQAVVARTYAWKAGTTGGKHGDGSVCTDASCCQAYLDQSEFLGNGGKPDSMTAAEEAVTATWGQVLTYRGSLIEATYFSCSGGSTEDAVAVWGTDYPYLRATDSPGEEQATHYTDTVTFTKEEFARALGVSLGEDPLAWVGFTTYTAGGGVNTMRIGGRDFSGTQLRSLLGLRSTAFHISTESDGVTIITRGYGHRVGMSQYGADAMASKGSSYDEILAYYYRGTELTRIRQETN